MARIVTALAPALLGLSCLGPTDVTNPPNEAYLEEVETWHRERIERLKRPDGWLTLVGLFWLEPGENRFGTDPSNDLVFPADTGPGYMGSFHLKDSAVTLEAAPGVEVTSGGKPVGSTSLRSDADGEPTLLELGPVSFFVIQRGEDLGVRVKDSQSSTLAGFTGIERYPVAENWRHVGRFEPYDPPKPIPVPNALGKTFQEPSPGAVVFEVDGKSHRLDALPSEGELFLVFGDQSNGKETYGGGRFLYTSVPTAEGEVIVDFNKAYNPPCVFTPYATCPLPPAQNRLAMVVDAGERMYGDLKH